MILDNRQVVPDIIVSRDGVPNHSIAYNINSNFNNNQENRVGQPERGGVEDASPRHFPKCRPHEVPRHAYVTGNNNGSPRHVPHNGNYYSEPKVSPAYQRTDKVINRGSPLHSKTIRGTVGKGSSNFDDSPHHSPHFDTVSGERNQRSPRHSFSIYESPVHNRYSLQRNVGNNEMGPREHFQNYDNGCDQSYKVESPRKYSYNRDSNYGSPIHQNNRSSNVKQGIFYSPKHLPKNSHLFSPRKVHPFHLDKRNSIESVRKDGHHLFFQNEAFRPRSSSHPCEGSKFPSYGQSKIPVHVAKSRTRRNSGEFDEKMYVQAYDNGCNSKLGSPCKNLNNKKHKILNTNTLSRKGSVPEFHNQDHKKVVNEYTTFSPKKVNLRNKNQNLVKAPSCRSDLRQKSLPSSRQNSDSQGWNANRRESLESKQWNGDTWQWNRDKSNSLTMDTNNSWNIENERSEEENDFSSHNFRVIAHQESNKNGSRNRLGSWHSAGSVKGSYSDCEDDLKADAKSIEEENEDSGVEADGSLGSKMVLIKCKDANYLTRIFVSNGDPFAMRDSSNYTIEQRILASTWVHERPRNGKTIENIRADFQGRFNRADFQGRFNRAAPF